MIVNPYAVSYSAIRVRYLLRETREISVRYLLRETRPSGAAHKRYLTLISRLFLMLLASSVGCGTAGRVGAPATAEPASGKLAQIEHAEAEATAKWNTESYDAVVENEFQDALSNPQSTFAIDVDTASYGIVRRKLHEGFLPPSGAVRIEELVNYFHYEYAPLHDAHPFSVQVDAGDCPWNQGHRLVRIAVKGKEPPANEVLPSNLVFLLDVSGSMNQPDKLPLAKSALSLLLGKLTAADRISIVTYAGASGVVLAPTRGDRSAEISAALNSLVPSGGTDGAQGIELAYQLAESNFLASGNNRIILCTDGDFNLGVTNQSELISLIERKAKSGVFLTVLGFGTGNYKDSTMEKLADKGNGNYAYIDSFQEARKVLVEKISATLVAIAQDVKIQIDVNPHFISAYRLIGYENRLLSREDFRDDSKDAGEIGAGHTVTAFYEVVPAGQPSPARKAAESEFVNSIAKLDGDSTAALTVNLRYKLPMANASQEFQIRLPGQELKSPSQTTVDFRFASSVVVFGMLLRESKHAGSASWNWVIETAQANRGSDTDGSRTEFIELAKTARALQARIRR